MKLYYYGTEISSTHHRIYARNDQDVMRKLDHLQDILVLVYSEEHDVWVRKD
jgi:hypothetical protein